MTDDHFWQIVQKSFDRSGGEMDEHAKALKDELQALSADEVDSFNWHVHSHLREAYTYDLWGAAYVIGGGCSDDGFEYFRRWLISRGREWYFRALNDPDSLADYPEDHAVNIPEFEDFTYTVYDVYKGKTGKTPEHGLAWPRSAAGETWEDDDDTLRRRWPRLFEKYG